jgi:hypothetical protein
MKFHAEGGESFLVPLRDAGKARVEREGFADQLLTVGLVDEVGVDGWIDQVLDVGLDRLGLASSRSISKTLGAPPGHAGRAVRLWGRTDCKSAGKTIELYLEGTRSVDKSKST